MANKFLNTPALVVPEACIWRRSSSRWVRLNLGLLPRTQWYHQSAGQDRMDYRTAVQDLVDHFGGVKAGSGGWRRWFLEHAWRLCCAGSHSATANLNARSVGGGLRCSYSQERQWSGGSGRRPGSDFSAVPICSRIALEVNFKPDYGQSGQARCLPFCSTQADAGRYRNQGQDPPSVYCGGLKLSERRHSVMRSSRPWTAPGIVVDCNIMCAELLDLYGSVTVGKSQFMYPGSWFTARLASTGCGAKCGMDTDRGLTSSSSRVRSRTSVACSASSARFFRKPIIRFWTSCSVQRLALTASTATAR